MGGSETLASLALRKFIIVIAPVVSPAMPLATGGECAVCEEEHMAFPFSEPNSVLKRGFVSLHTAMPHRLWVTDAWVENKLSEKGANETEEYSWAKGDRKSFTTAVNLFTKQHGSSDCTGFHVFRETAPFGDRRSGRATRYWCLSRCPIVEKPLHTYRQQDAMCRKIEARGALVAKFATERSYMKEDKNGVCMLPGWKSFMQSLAGNDMFHRYGQHTGESKSTAHAAISTR